MISLTEDHSVLTFESLLSVAPRVTSFTTSRHGGFSQGKYASFNPSPYSGDDEVAVKRNLEKLENSLPEHPVQLFRPRQVHGVETRVIDASFLSLTEEEQKLRLTGVDALIAALPGYAVCVSTADCVPIVLYDRCNNVVAAVHAGWRGTVKRILRRVLQMMNSLYGTVGEDIFAAIGPSISLKAFEVGEEVYDEFQNAGFDMSSISVWNDKTNKHHMDLWKANSLQLEDFGVSRASIEISGICTYTQCEDFFSARRLGKQSGRILTGIMINRSENVF